MPLSPLASQTAKPACIANAGSLTPLNWSASPSVSDARAASRIDMTRRAPLALVADVPLPGPAKRFDYQNFDATAGRLYISHMRGDRLEVVDTRAGKLVASIQGVSR